jgi:hypothetical protein
MRVTRAAAKEFAQQTAKRVIPSPLVKEPMMKQDNKAFEEELADFYWRRKNKKLEDTGAVISRINKAIGRDSTDEHGMQITYLILCIVNGEV